ncbi:MAG: TIGR01212 family radical SAM protein [Ruminococcaceae bacterium]|nr:TIGR01212 family radical SAM protein [Oscillospiraceae bacterium]
MAQKDTNPYPYSDSNKRYMTYDWYLKQRFGGKVAKVPLDIGCTCPNLDGTRGHGGCIYCLNGSSGVVDSARHAPIAEQYSAGIAVAEGKWKPVGYIPYLQSNSNTYGNAGRLLEIYEECVDLPHALMLNIATRADCLTDEILSGIGELGKKIPVMVELGLQTSDDATAERINRCHTFREFTEGYGRLRETGVMIGVHIINGLPGEDRETMLRTAEDVASLRPDMVKIHLLHVLKGTVLCRMYERGEYTPFERDEYVSIVCDQLEILPPEVIIGRVTGDGLSDELVCPIWSRRKTEVANEIDKELYRRGSFQGMRYSGKTKGEGDIA